MFAYINPNCATLLRKSMEEKVKELVTANDKISGKYIERMLQSRG